jgi:ribosomal-protein-alanine N-acetyltransferase
MNVAYSNWTQLSPTGESPRYLIFEPMRRRDVKRVAEIEKASFPTPYDAETFRAELSCADSSWWIVRPFAERPLRTRAPAVAYVGYLLREEGAHIAKIATHPGWRRRGLGEWMLLNMLLAARMEGAWFVSLEVRSTNVAARQLYRKWGFVALQRIAGYYDDTGEDGLILALGGLRDDGFEDRVTQEMKRIVVHPSDGE